MLQSQVQRQLVAAGYRVALLDRADHDRLWKEEAEAAGGLYDAVSGAPRPAAQAAALAGLATRVCREAKCALLMRPRLVMRHAELQQRVAEWDGQRRLIAVSKTGGTLHSFSGSIGAISVEMLALGADGRLAFRTFGGAAMPYAADTIGAQFELRPDLFADDAEIADGVRIALAPLRSGGI